MRRLPVATALLLTTVLFAIAAAAPAQAQVTALTLSVDKPSPQRVGATMTFTATASGGSGLFEYQYWLGSGSGAYAPVSPVYVPGNTLVWTPAVAGSYKVMVYARTQGSTAAFEKSAVKSGYWVVAEPPVTAVVLSATKASPQQVGVPVTFSAAASGGSASYEYQFWLSQGGSAYRLVKEYAVPGDAWTPGTGDMDTADSYVVKVNARNSGSIAPFEKSTTKNFVTMAGVPVKSVSLSADKASPQDLTTVGTVTFTAAAVPGVAGDAVEYQFWLCTGVSGKYVAVGDATTDYSAANTWHWTPAAAETYKVMVYARTVGNTVAYEKLRVLFFTVFDFPPTLGEVTPSMVTSPADSPRTFSAVYSDEEGYGALKIVSLLVNQTASEASGIYVRYDRAVNRLYLVDDAGTAYVGNCVPGSAATLTNSQGSLNCAATSVAGSGPDLTVDWSVTAKPAFVSAAAKNLYTHAKDMTNIQVGWVDKGDWTITASVDLTLCVECHDGNPDYPLAPNVINGQIPGQLPGSSWSYNWFGTDPTVQDGGHGDPQGRDNASTVPACTGCHDLSQPAPGNLHLNGVYESIWDNTTRNANTAHLKAEFFTKYPANAAGAWSTQVAFDRYCFLECHAAKNMAQMTHETDTQPSDPAHDSLRFGTHLTYSNADTRPYPVDRDLTTDASGTPFFAPCVSCHDPHGTTVPPQNGSKSLMMRDNWADLDATLCKACHP